jgi:hypothetical protein
VERAVNPKLKKLISIFSVISVFALLLVFQNCSGSSSSSQSPSITTRQNNGEGYRGKLTYINRGSCGGAEMVKSRIEVSADRQSALMLRRDCVDITPEYLNTMDFDLAFYNLDNLLFTNRTFDLEKQNLYSRFLCRGTDPYSFVYSGAGVTPAQVSGDAVIYKAGSGYSGKIKLGWEDVSGLPLASWSSSNFYVMRQDSSGYEQYSGGDIYAPVSGTTGSGVQTFNLVIPVTGTPPFFSSMTVTFTQGVTFPQGYQVNYATVNINCYPQ